MKSETDLTDLIAENNQAFAIMQSVAWKMKWCPSGTTLGNDELIRLFEKVNKGMPPVGVGHLNAIRELIKDAGDNPDREGLKDTPARFLKAIAEYTSGIGQDPKALLKSFVDGSKGYDELVIEKNIHFTSTCEHHLAPFFGHAHVGYIPAGPPKGKIVGLSKLARLVDCLSRRFQVQERLTRQIADTLQEVLEPTGVAVVIEATHTCMECRGVRKIGATTITSAMLGAMRDNASARAEFMSLIGRV